jgi:hypothetical protein
MSLCSIATKFSFRERTTGLEQLAREAQAFEHAEKGD